MVAGTSNLYFTTNPKVLYIIVKVFQFAKNVAKINLLSFKIKKLSQKM